MYTQDYDSMTDEQVVKLAQGTDAQALEYLLKRSVEHGADMFVKKSDDIVPEAED